MSTAGRAATFAVVGGGITGLIAARALARLRPEARVVLLEADDRLGGKIRSDTLEGRVAEAGPDSFLTRDDGARRLCEELGLADELIAPAAFGAHIWSRGRLRRLPKGFVLGVPASPLALLRSGLLSPRGALRALGDIVLPGPLSGPDVSVGALVRRRFGYEVLERIVDPILAGTRAGDPDMMGLAAAAPQVDAAARSHRSVLLGLMRAGAGGAPAFLGLRGGMALLVDRLSGSLGDRVELRTGALATSITVRPTGLAVDTPTGPVIADAVVVTVPAFAAARLLRATSPEASRALEQISYAALGLVTLVYPPGAGVLPAEGSGILVPSEERATVSGCTWTSRKWPHLAPPDGALVVRAVIGRAGPNAAIGLDDAELVARVDADLRMFMGLNAPPRAAQVVRWSAGQPQYGVGHLDLVDEIDRALPPEIAVAGSAYRGSGLMDCVSQGEAAARRVLEAVPVETRDHRATLAGRANARKAGPGE